MLERDPELEAMLAPERQAPPPPPAALTERLWQRISASVRTAPTGARGPIGPALLIITSVVGAAVGAWAVSSFRSQAPAPEPASAHLVESPKVDARVDAGETAAAPTAQTDEAAPPPREPDSRRPPSAEERAGKRVLSRVAVREALVSNRLLEAAAALTKHETEFPEEDVREEREALLVLTTAFSRSTGLPTAVKAFRTTYPNSTLLVAVPTDPPPVEGLGTPGPSGQGCSVSGRVTFSSRDPKVKTSDLVVYLAKARSAQRSEPRRHEIVQKNRQFSPRMLIIQKNDSVSFPNRDNTEHSVFTADRTTVRINPTRKAEPEPVAFLKEGGFRLQCDIHSNMSAWVVVVPVLELATQVADDGTWRINHVPKGPLLLKVLEPNGKSVEVRVAACADGTALEVDLEGNEAPQLKRFNGSPYSEYQP